MTPDWLAWRLMYLRRVARERPFWTGTLGWPAYLTLALAPLCGPLAKAPLRPIRLRGYRRPFHYRVGTSDLWVIRQVFALGEYECVGNEPDVRFIIDCGANIGCTGFYLLHRYPRARLVAVEPDPGNMAVCKRNLAPFAGRVTFVQAGVWSAAAPMVLDRGFRDGAEWSIQVRPARPREKPDFTATTMADVIARSGFPRVDLLKMDIEAAEAEVFRSGAGDWLPRVRTLAIELHGPECEKAVTEALADFRHTTERSGELTIFRDLIRTV